MIERAQYTTKEFIMDRESAIQYNIITTVIIELDIVIVSEQS